MSTLFSLQHPGQVRRQSFKLSPRYRWLISLALLLALGALFLTGDPFGAGPACRDAPARRCTFGNAPPTVGAEAIQIPGKPHLYARLVTPVSFTDPSGTVWTAPSGTLTDGASIPPVFVPLIGEPRSTEFFSPAALHDAYCGAGNEQLNQFRARSWEETHRMFYHGLRAAGVPPAKAKVMFAAVYLGGPRWNDPSRSLEGVPDTVLRREMEACLRFIERERPTLAEIEAWMRRRESGILSTASATAP